MTLQRERVRAFRAADRALKKAARTYTHALANYKSGHLIDPDVIDQRADELADAAVNFALAAAEYAEIATLGEVRP